ncbi:hypothetical protein [Flexivirga oryzae]|uniref:Uncharacterized protein n=1 Tax=Flexivirga oryzae TaxID=1794944 RepID=A0A839N7E5_9MICO|nr:hypothetical protein [Flexivirga oryzae]MBB2891145.1 hypothetical protein [Flexivirga oryzae]
MGESSAAPHNEERRQKIGQPVAAPWNAQVAKLSSDGGVAVVLTLCIPRLKMAPTAEVEEASELSETVVGQLG